ncbi:MAG: VOC family protein, partial [Nanoarchaeota archaeon]
MNPIVHFDLPADDLQRAQQFYTELFGWEFKKAPGMEYYLVRTSHEPVELGGGMGLRQDEQQQIMHFISVEDIEHMKKRIQSSGGEAGDR